jgi:hypothetical protein
VTKPNPAREEWTTWPTLVQSGVAIEGDIDVSVSLLAEKSHQKWSVSVALLAEKERWWLALRHLMPWACVPS